MILLNFAHPVTAEQEAQIEALASQHITQVIYILVQFDHDQPYLPQLAKLMEKAPLSPEQWQNEPLLVNLPSMNTIAAALLAELHGRMGYFPAVLRLRPVKDALPPRYEAAEILNLQAVRDHARQKR